MELIIAGAIISVGFLSVVSLIFNAFTNTASLSGDLTASYLTQEGFEIVRRIRDTNFNTRYEEGDDYFWLEGLMNETAGEGEEVTGSVDYNSTTLEGNQDQNLHIDGDGLYSYDSTGERTPFKRKITLKRDCFSGYSDTNDFDDDFCNNNGAEYVLVTVEVTWEDGGKNNSYEAETKLFNWY